jgi:hypothetical protein
MPSFSISDRSPLTARGRGGSRLPFREKLMQWLEIHRGFPVESH